MDTVEFKGKTYPKLITEGQHSQYIIPTAKKFCTGLIGYDIGCNKKEWAFPGAIPIDITLDNNNYDAFNLPTKPVDYIFSSHCLEHLNNYVDALEYWTFRIKKGGTLFLYLPHENCEYWKPWIMPTKKHLHQFYPEQIKEILSNLGYINIFSTGCDLAFSFAVVGEKAW